MADQVVIVTGGGDGIGLAIVKLLLQSAKVSHVIAVDLNVDRLETLQKDNQNRLYPMVGDVSDRSVNLKAVEAAIKHGGHLNSIILNAGIVKPIGPLATVDVEDWKKAYDVNLFALLHLIQHAWPHLTESRGNVLMTSTDICTRPTDSWVCYASTKTALNYLCSCIPLEDSRISSIAIQPGAVDTPAQTRAREDKNVSKELQTFLRALKTEGRLLRPEQPASAFVKLVETGIPPELTGKTIHWDQVVGETK